MIEDSTLDSPDRHNSTTPALGLSKTDAYRRRNIKIPTNVTNILNCCDINFYLVSWQGGNMQRSV